jgi:hypothetical protein
MEICNPNNIAGITKAQLISALITFSGKREIIKTLPANIVVAIFFHSAIFPFLWNQMFLKRKTFTKSFPKTHFFIL